MKRITLIGAACVGFLTACDAPVVTQELSLTDRLAGNTFVDDRGNTLTYNKDGTLLGKTLQDEVIAGVWEERGGQFCRTLTQPIQNTACLDLIFDGNSVYGIRPDGSKTPTAVLQ